MPSPDLSPAIVLAEIRGCLLAELMAKPAPEPISLRRDIAVLILASLGEVIDRVDALAEGSAAADRLRRELDISRADTGRLELLLAAVDLDRITRPRLSLVRGGDVVDLTEAFRRERACHVRPNDGGDAA